MVAWCPPRGSGRCPAGHIWDGVEVAVPEARLPSAGLTRDLLTCPLVRGAGCGLDPWTGLTLDRSPETQVLVPLCGHCVTLGLDLTFCKGGASVDSSSPCP